MSPNPRGSHLTASTGERQGGHLRQGWSTYSRPGGSRCLVCVEEIEAAQLGRCPAHCLPPHDQIRTRSCIWKPRHVSVVTAAVTRHNGCGDPEAVLASGIPRASGYRCKNQVLLVVHELCQVPCDVGTCCEGLSMEYPSLRDKLCLFSHNRGYGDCQRKGRHNHDAQHLGGITRVQFSIRVVHHAEDIKQIKGQNPYSNSD